LSESSNPASEERPVWRWVSFTSPGFSLYWAAQLAAGFAVQIQTVAVGWQIYDLTRDPLDLGLVGLSQFLPALLLVLVTGAASDRFPRRTIMGICLAVEAGCAAAFMAFTLSGLADIRILFLILAVLGVARTFYNPARQSIVPNLVPTAHLANAITLVTTAGQIATIAGPVMGGLLYGVTPVLAYASALTLLAVAAALVLRIPRPPQRIVSQHATMATLLAGFRYISSEKIVLGAISLDLFAVLLGGATALMPVYARDILDAGPWGLGLLRAGPAFGAIAVGFYLMTHPIRDHAGPVMFAAVAFFGLFTVIFGVSEILWLSVLALAGMGACDMVSVYVRNTLIQLWTPDPLRGRVNAVNQVFIGASNELGGFRAGLSAALIGAVPAVLIGGVGTIAVAALWFHWFPELRRTRRLDGRS
jgi:MFS family permease